MRVNPILARELRQRMRGKRVVFMLTMYLVLVTATMLIAHSAASNSNPLGGDQFFEGEMNIDALLPMQAGTVGRSMFTWTVVAMFGLLALALPTMAAGAIAGERERDTLTPMLVTPLGPIRLVLGKLMSSLAFVVLMLIAALPILTVAYVVGGVTIDEVVLSLVSLIIAAIVFASIGVGISALTKRTLTAALLTNLIVGTLLIGTLVGSAVLESEALGAKRPLAARWPLLVNPVVLTGDMIGDETAPAGNNQVWDAIKRRYTSKDSDLLVPDNEFFEFGMNDAVAARAINIDGEPIFDPQAEEDDAPWRKDAWNWPVRSMTALALVSAMFLALAAFRLRTPVKKDR